MRRLVLLIAVAALAAGAWLVFGSGTGDLTPIGSESGQMSQQVDSSVDAFGESITTDQVEQTEEAAAARSQVELSEASAGKGPEQIRILVTNKETGEPIPDATVSYFDTGSLNYSEMSTEEQQEYQTLARDLEKLTKQYGETVLANSEGQLYLPAKKQGFIQVAGRQDQLYGQLNINRNLLGEDEKREYRLELEDDLILRVQVLDSLGKPAIGVPLLCQPKDVVSNMYYFGEVARSEAPDGMARIPHLQIVVQNWQQQGEDGREYLLQASVPGMVASEPLFDPQSPPEEPLVLRLPPTGRVIVKTVDDEGKPVDTGYNQTALSLSKGLELGRQSEYRNSDGRRWQADPPKNGKAVFNWVVVRETYMAGAYMLSEQVQEVFAGPQRTGDEVTITLSPNNKSYTVVGRILNEDLEPVANKRFHFLFEFGSRRRNNNYSSTDDSGRFVIVVGREGQEGSLESFSIMPETYGQATKSEVGVYNLPRSMPLVLGRNDLGDLVLAANPVVASGRVLVDGEAPERDKFALQIERWIDAEHSRRRKEGWESDESMTFKFTGGGRFEVHGTSQPARYRIAMQYFSSPGTGGRLDFLPRDPLEFSIGAEDVTLRMTTGGSLTAAVILDAGIQVQNLFLQVAPSEGEFPDEMTDPRYIMPIPYGKRQYGQHSGTQEGQHEFRWGALLPGNYRLDILPRGARKPIMTIDGIVIRKGERTQDPRLNPIDLRDKLRRIKITLQDREGNRLAQGNYGPPLVILNDPNPDAELTGYMAANSAAVILTGEPYLDLLIVSRSYQPTEVFAVREDQTVTVDPFPEVLVRIAGGLPEISGKFSLRLYVNQKERKRDKRKLSSDYGMSGTVDNWLQPMGSMKRFDAKGEVRVSVGSEGRYSVSIRLRDEDSRNSVTISGLQPAEIQVQIGNVGEQVFTIQIPAEELKKAIEASEK